VLLVAANLINIGADIGAIGAAAALVIPVPAAALMVVSSAVILVLEVRVSYRRYARYLKWLTVSLLAYPLTAFLVHDPWPTIFRATLSQAVLLLTFTGMAAAVVATVISYLGDNRALLLVPLPDRSRL
jgi:Mn2+/Fe2+ NRAMP family transporter